MNVIKLEDFPVESLQQGSEINVLVGETDPRLVELLFGPPLGEEPDPDEVFIETPQDITWPQLLAALGCFPSTTQAKKNWCRGMKRNPEPSGYEEVTIGKARKIFIFLFKERPENL